MIFNFEIEVEVERETGKFMSRDEIEEQLVEKIESGDLSDDIYGGPDGDSTYNVVNSTVNPVQYKKNYVKKSK